MTMNQQAKTAAPRSYGFMIQDTAILSFKREATELALVALHQVESRSQGAGSLSGLAGLHDLSSRNSVSDRRLKHGIQVQGKCCTHQHHWNGSTHPKCYWPTKWEQAYKVTKLGNRLYGVVPLSQRQSKSHSQLVEQFPIRINSTEVCIEAENHSQMLGMPLVVIRRSTGEMTA